MISEPVYLELMKNCSKWNSKVMSARKNFVFDQQTNIVHRPSNHLYHQPYERKPSKNPLQVYTYPARRWVKAKSHCSASMEMNLILRANPAILDASNALLTQSGLSQLQPLGETSFEQTTNATPQTRGSVAKMVSDGLLDTDVAEFDFDEPDNDPPSADEEDWGSKRKRKKVGVNVQVGGGGNSLKTKRMTMASSTPSGPKDATSFSGGTPVTDHRPFACNMCVAKYKSRPGLTYHKIHVHGNGSGEAAASKSQSPIISPKVTFSNYCDFCLGGRDANPQGTPEDLVSCHDCGRSGHPSCLKFTENMLISTKRHGWQCIECKSCAICGTSENDDKLLFCDDCDRGFHLYCLSPPLSSPPESDWSCYLCIKSFGAQASINKFK